MQEIIAQLTESMNRLKAKKQQIVIAKTTNYDAQIAEYQKAIDTLKVL